MLCELSIMANAISYITLVPLAKTSHKRKTFSLPSSSKRICFSTTIDSTLPVGTLISSQTDNQLHSWWTFFDSYFIMINFYDELKFSNSPVYSTPFPHSPGYKKCQKWKSDYHSSSYSWTWETSEMFREVTFTKIISDWCFWRVYLQITVFI